MSNEVEIVNDGEGFALFGDRTAVEQFLKSSNLTSRELDLTRLGARVAAASNATQAASVASQEFGRWVKLTKDSAAALKGATLMKGSRPGVSRAIIVDGSKKTSKILEFAKSPAGLIANPALLTGVAGVMSQYAMQKQMEQITEYLAVIDAKVDDILRGQKDSVLAEMIGVDFVLDEAFTVREHVGRVSDVTWSKVQATALSISKTQAYALRQLEGVTEKVEKAKSVDEMAKISKEVEGKIREWLAVLARSVQLQDGIAVLELDRVLDSSPEDLDKHRIALRAARDNRRELIVSQTRTLIGRMAVSADHANTKVFLNPIKAKAVVQASNRIAADVVAFLNCMGVETEDTMSEAKRWRVAAVEAGDKALEVGATGLSATAKVSVAAADRAKVISTGLADRVKSRLDKKKDPAD